MTFVFDPFLCFISMTLLFDLFRCFYDSLLWPVSLIHSFVLMTPYFVYFLWPVPLFLWLLTLTRFFYPFLYFVSMTPVFWSVSLFLWLVTLSSFFDFDFDFWLLCPDSLSLIFFWVCDVRGFSVSCRKNVCEEDAKQLERLFNMFSSCLELLEVELFQTLRLQKMFPLQSGTAQQCVQEIFALFNRAPFVPIRIKITLYTIQWETFQSFGPSSLMSCPLVTPNLSNSLGGSELFTYCNLLAHQKP